MTLSQEKLLNKKIKVILNEMTMKELALALDLGNWKILMYLKYFILEDNILKEIDRLYLEAKNKI